MKPVHKIAIWLTIIITVLLSTPTNAFCNYFIPSEYFPDNTSTSHPVGYWDSFGYYIGRLEFTNVYGFECIDNYCGTSWYDNEKEWLIIVELSGVIHFYRIVNWEIRDWKYGKIIVYTLYDMNTVAFAAMDNLVYF